MMSKLAHGLFFQFLPSSITEILKKKSKNIFFRIIFLDKVTLKICLSFLWNLYEYILINFDLRLG